MGVATIENELGKMTNAERLVVIEIAHKLIHGETNGKLRFSLDQKRAKLKKSAELMLAEYVENKKLTEMSGLDAEDFLDE
jgi:hypothetical protein